MLYKLPDSHWINSWKDTASVTVTYDLQQSVKPGAVQFWFNDTMPAFEVQGSKDQKTWQSLGSNSQIVEAGADVKDISVSLDDKSAYQYMRVIFAARNEGQTLSLVESEVWEVVGE